MVHGKPTRGGEQGYILIGLIVAIFLMLLALSVAAPRVARALRRDRELEAQRRGRQYVRAVQLYYRKNGTYPGSIEQLQKSNNIRFLRQKYVDPLTGKADWRLIHVGEAKTTVKGFFGQPLAGISSPGSLGSIAGMASNIGGTGTTTTGSSPTGTSSFGSSSFGGSSFGSGSTGTSGLTSGGIGTSAPTDSSSPTTPATGGTSTSSPSTGGIFGSSGVGSQSATTFQGGGAPIMGVGSLATGNSILVVNEQTSYPKWEFIYDPRIEQLYAKANVYGGSIGSTPASSFGSGTSGTGSGFGSTSPGSTSPSGGSSGFGSSSFGSSSFGSSSFGSSGSSSGSSTPTTPTTPQ